ncbi:ubiquinone biosynthesis O-methyltransferase [Anaplasma platys]|uniref:Ubiquinone biosynthesis O-methyltransferase n=1 Tax=Anaplasma platys TaxID=949 RepID=A0A858PY99_9RICK|nr:bifunctional 2-polyprenyl-6-hydroxyphenol methylase/3-demethylubiquinol 3-O-methyltransferase UbiG [Anaplasma platys]QJC27538.1 ubiquinone biosynthesis O-methyltransferase [Anaplasma platys]
MTSVDHEEVKRFSSFADMWWTGENFEILHKINPLRVKYILAHLPREIKELRFLDIGCGGGILCESLAKLGMKVTGIDPSEEGISVARDHAKKGGLDIEYHATNVDAFREDKKGICYDAIALMEVVEHANSLSSLLADSCKLLKKGGIVFVSTLNRTIKALLLGIIAAEYVLGWVPRGTHTWKKFVKPSEIYEILQENEVIIQDIKGIVYKVLENKWLLSDRDIGVNYIIAARKIR